MYSSCPISLLVLKEYKNEWLTFFPQPVDFRENVNEFHTYSTLYNKYGACIEGKIWGTVLDFTVCLMEYISRILYTVKPGYKDIWPPPGLNVLNPSFLKEIS